VSDLIAPAIALGHGFGRLGCFSAGCCYGRSCSLPWGAVFKSDYAHQLTGIPLNMPLHPVQLYEAVLNF
jgi:phosphatidylglycerol:prolipoprotein diacylglycerol transferase